MSDLTLSKIYLTTEKNQFIIPTDPILPTNINLFLSVSINLERINILKNIWNFEDYNQYFDNIVLAHYCGITKPWNYVSNEDFINKLQKQLYLKYKRLQNEIKEKNIEKPIFVTL